MSGFVVQCARKQSLREGAPFRCNKLPDGTPWTQFYRLDGAYLLRFPGIADFEVSADGCSVVGIPIAGTSADMLEHLYLNQVLPLCASKQGKLVYHASAVEVAGCAVAFVAESGRGKSTLAANLAVSGYCLLTDDGLVLEPDATGHRVIPSHPSIRLWQDSQDYLLPPDVKAAAPLHFTAKGRFLAGDGLGFCHEPRPLRCVYFLGDGSAQDIAVSRATAAETLLQLLRHSFLLDIEDKALIAGHFERTATLANTLPCFHLDYPRRYDDLGRLLKMIVTHASSEGGPA